MKPSAPIPIWTIAAPMFAGAVLLAAGFGFGGIIVAFISLALAGSVFAAVHHAEVIAHRVGEPYGTLVLALAVTLIEVALIVSLMAAGGEEAAGLARDTVFAAVMIILNGIIGLCLLVGGLAHREQTFSLDGVSAALVALATIVIMTLIFPNYTVTTPGPYYSSSQLILIAVVTLVIYGTFVLAQTIGHRQYFLQDDEAEKSTQHTALPSNTVAASSAGIVLLPEGLAALRAARSNHLQTSLNLALGSALASIGLTIPAVSFVSLYTNSRLRLGVDAKSSLLLLLSLF